MNIELKPRTDLFLVPAPAPANGNSERSQTPLPKRHVIIYKPAKAAMTSGRGGTKQWVLEFEPQSPPFREPLMGWTGSTDPLAYTRLMFPTCEAAVAYAKRQSLDYEVRDYSRSAKVRVAVAKQPSPPMPLWPLPDPEWNGVLVPEIGEEQFASGIAA